MTTDLNVEVIFSRTRRSTASLKYTPEGRFVLSVPDGAPKDWIGKFLASKRAWMEKIRKRAEKENGARNIAPGALIETEFYSLRVEADAALKYPQYRVDRKLKDRISTFYLAPEFFASENSAKLFAQLEKYLLAQIVKLGSPALLERARYWADLHGIKVKEFFIRVQKSRLGYCTFDDRIMLNGRLLFSSPRLRDYVICHELAHTKHKNHSKRYWAYLEKLFPGARLADKALRDTTTYGMRVGGE